MTQNNKNHGPYFTGEEVLFHLFTFSVSSVKLQSGEDKTMEMFWEWGGALSVFLYCLEVKCYLQLDSLGSFFRMKPLEASPLLMMIRSSEISFCTFPVQGMLMFLWQT